MVTCNCEHPPDPGTLDIRTAVIVGMGCDVTVKDAAPLVEPPGPGLLTINEPTVAFCRSVPPSATCRVVEFTNIVGRGEPFHSTTESVSNPVPVTVMVAAVPASTSWGEMLVTTGVGLVTLKVVALEPPPPGAGFDTVNISAALPEMSAAGSAALSSAELTTDVVRGLPFQFTIEDGTKPLPVISSVIAPAPATTVAGFTAFTTGRGLFTVKFAEAEVPPPGAGLYTVIGATPPFVRSLPGTVAVRLVSDV
jgi:hypothetical protein